MGDINTVSMLSQILNQLELVQGSRGLKFVEGTFLLTSLAAITNIAVSILKVFGSIIQRFAGEKNTHFKSALKQFAWGVITWPPIFGGIVALAFMGYHSVVNERKKQEVEKESYHLNKRVNQLMKSVKICQVKKANLTGPINSSEFPELAGKELLLVPGIEKMNGNQPQSPAQVDKLAAFFKGKKVNVLSIVGIEEESFKSGSVSDLKTRLNFFKNIEKLLEKNEFDLIILLKKYKPKEHNSFTSFYYNIEESSDSITLSLNDEGKRLGVKISEFWKTAPTGQLFNMRENKDGSIVFEENKGAVPIKGTALKGLKEKSLMPFAIALRSTPIKPEMFKFVTSDKIKQEKIIDDLQAIFILSYDEVRINPDFQMKSVKDMKLSEAFNGNGVWNAIFLQEVKNELGVHYSLETTKVILVALLENLTHDYASQGTEPSQFHGTLVSLLEKHVKHIPIVPVLVGYDVKSNSAGLDERQCFTSSYLPLLTKLDVKENVVVGVDQDSRLTNTALDAQNKGIATVVVTPCLYGGKPQESKEAQNKLKRVGVVTNNKV